MKTRRAQVGQAIVMVTVMCMALFGILGLAVDVGWAFFSKKAAQAATDAAAMAAAQATLYQIGQGNSFRCGVDVVCQPEKPCASQTPRPPASPIDNGCLYAERNGFRHGGSGNQVVTMESGTSVPPPLAPGVNAKYWVTARAGQNIPRLFSVMLGGPGTTGTSATAAIVDMSVYGSLMLLNRETDCLPMEGPGHDVCGVNLLVSSNDNQGHPALEADGGIFMASTKDGRQADGRYAGENTGGGTVKAPFTYIQGEGGYKVGGSARWVEIPGNKANPNLFLDPMRGKGQPPAPAGLVDRPVPGGAIVGSTDPANPVVLQPGNYFATNADGTAATGNPISIEGNVRFAAAGAGFGQYVLFGGVRISKQATTVTFEPGMYVFAGVRSGPLFSVTSNASLRDLTSGFAANTDAGELFVFTDANYKGQSGSLEIPAMVRPIAAELKQGTAGFQAGSNADVYLNLHGLNRRSSQLPEGLKDFSPVMIWQDQANSTVKYTDKGDIDVSCGNPAGCPNTALANAQSTQMFLQGSPGMHFYGAVYQPRGAWISVVGGGDYQVPVQVIAGALRVQGNSNFSMVQPSTPMARRTVALVQ